MSHGVENYFPSLWGTDIFIAILFFTKYRSICEVETEHVSYVLQLNFTIIRTKNIVQTIYYIDSHYRLNFKLHFRHCFSQFYGQKR